MESRWKRGNQSVYNTSFHIIFCPTYRRKVLVGVVEKRLRERIEKKCSLMKIEIGRMEVMPDHVHLFLRASPTDTPHVIVGQIKGYTSRILRQEFIYLKRRLPALWTRSDYIESIGHISQRTIEKYIEEQKMK